MIQKAGTLLWKQLEQSKKRCQMSISEIEVILDKEIELSSATSKQSQEKPMLTKYIQPYEYISEIIIKK